MQLGEYNDLCNDSMSRAIELGDLLLITEDDYNSLSDSFSVMSGMHLQTPVAYHNGKHVYVGLWS